MGASLFEPKIGDVCSKSPNNPRVLVLDSKKLIAQLIEKQEGIAPIDLDTSGDGISSKQEAEALLNPDLFCSTNRCGKNVSVKLGKAFVDLYDFIQRHAKPVDQTKDSIDTRKLTDATMLKAFVRGNAAHDIASCTAVAAAPTSSPSQESSGPRTNKRQQATDYSIPGFFSLRQSVDDLPVPQSDPSFKGVKQANVSFSDDRIAQKSSFSIKAAAGYTWGPMSLDEAGHYFARVTPFITYDQQYVETSVQKNNSYAQNVGTGLMGSLTFPALFGGYQNIQVYPKFVHSLRNSAEVLSGNLVYTPMFGIPGIDSATYLIEDLLSAKFIPQIRVVANDILDVGHSPPLLQGSSYYWIGPKGELKFFGEGLLDGFTFDTSYEAYATTGTEKQISYFQTALAYNFGAAKLMSVQLQYQKGRNLDTLEKIDQLSLGLGVKY